MLRTIIRHKPTPVFLAVWAVLAAPAAVAQQAQQPAAQEAAVTEIVISGSRIKRDNYSSAAPLQIIRNDDSAIAGFTSTAEVLQGTAVTGGQSQINNAFGGFVTDGGPGANTLGLRGFGPTRSLVLLNGRRLGPSGTRGSVGASDLNVLPGAIVDRIEVLKDGASSIYGSDAVAGVVNIITKRNITGFTGETRLTFPQDGGSEEARVSLVGGFVSDRAYISGSYEYSERKNLTLGDRDWTQCNTDYRRTSANGVVGEWGSFDFVDPKTGKPKCYPISGTGSNGVTINTLGTPTRPGVGAAGSVGTSFNRWRPNPAITTGLVGYEGVGGGANNLNVRDTFDPRMLNRSLISPSSGHNLFLQGGVDLPALGGAEVYYELLYNRRESTQTGYRQLSLDYPQGSPLLPAAFQTFAFLPPQAGGITGTKNVGVRGFIGFGNDTSSQEVDFARAVVGLKGSIGKSGWDYDIAFNRSDSKGKYTSQAFMVDRMTRSLDVVASGGGFSCANPADGCVAAPPLTAAVIGGQFPADWVNYVWRPFTGVTKYMEDVLSASVTGTLFNVPYGKVKAAVGAEARRFKIDDTPAIESQTGNLYGFTSAQVTRGNDTAKDLFAEVEVPLLSKVPYAHELTMNVSGRWSDYKTFGSGSTHKVGALWSPSKWFSIRATSGTSYRAPALYEQFLGSTSGFLSQQNDPCNNWGAANTTPVRAANCRSEGLAPDFQATSSIRVNGVGGAESGLKAETSKNNTVGFILQPALGEGRGDLSIAVDYFSIEVSNGVSRLSGSSILTRCYDDAQFRAGGAFCRLVDPRGAGAGALTVKQGFVNLSTDVAKGYDLTARYTNNIGSGKLRLNLTLTKFDNQSSKLFPEDPIDDFNGSLNNPKWSGGLDANYEFKAWRFYYGLDWIEGTSSYAYYGEDPATSTYKLDVPAYLLHTASVRYKAKTWEATVGVRNLFDKKPPVISAQAGYNRVGNSPLYSGYDYVGRTLFVNMSKAF
jgi:outer membrane receptor protein involved in Fe transport